VTLHITPIPAFQDNYIWCLATAKYGVVVDPGDAKPVLAFFKEHGLTLSDILLTHHHWDHTNGLPELVAAFPDVKVWGPNSDKIAGIDHVLIEGDNVSLPSIDCDFAVIEVPGHTLDHIAYYGSKGLFCGDTLFSAGCGRLFEGSPEQMQRSLAKLSALPPATQVFCTHEYTLANLKFATTVEPLNTNLLEYQHWAIAQRERDLPTLPSTLAKELAINPFLRCEQASVISAVTQHWQNEQHAGRGVFAGLRRWKDQF
jgi:hydroxyacylglutathione hydrolase